MSWKLEIPLPGEYTAFDMLVFGVFYSLIGKDGHGIDDGRVKVMDIRDAFDHVPYSRIVDSLWKMHQHRLIHVFDGKKNGFGVAFTYVRKSDELKKITEESEIAREN